MKVGKIASLSAVAFFAAAVGLVAQQPTSPPPTAASPAPAPAPKMTMDHGSMDEGMMARHREMMARMDAMDAKLDDLVKKMDAAQGNKKADAVAAVVSELVRQRKEMREHMKTMSPGMMHDMDCPMMKHKEGAPPAGKPEEHPGHH